MSTERTELVRFKSRLLMYLADLQLTYAPGYASNAQGDQKLYEFVTGLIEEVESWDDRQVTSKLKPNGTGFGSTTCTNDEKAHDRTTDDLISRQAAIDAVERVDWYHQNQHGEMVSGANSSEHQAWYRAEDIYDVLERLPSAQQEIIYCKDCKHYKHWYADRGRCFLWSEDGVSVFDDGFCNYAERRVYER